MGAAHPRTWHNPEQSVRRRRPLADISDDIGACTPAIGAMAITDYYDTDTYEEVLRRKQAGRLPNVQLIFPNVELRLDIAAKTGFVNLRLLLSPEDPII